MSSYNGCSVDEGAIIGAPSNCVLLSVIGSTLGIPEQRYRDYHPAGKGGLITVPVRRSVPVSGLG